MVKKYLQISFGDGKIFEYSKTAKEGFEEHTSAKGAVSYRRVLSKGLYGRLQGIVLKDGNFGDEIVLEVQDSQDVTNYLSIPLLSTNGNIGVYAEGLIKHLPFLEIGTGRYYRFYPYSMDVENSTFQKKGISIKYVKDHDETVYDEPEYKIRTLMPSYTEKATGNFIQGDIPAVQTTVNFKNETKRDSSEKDAYLYQTLLNFAKDTTKPKNQNSQQGQAPAPQAPTQQPAPAPVPQSAPAPAPSNQPLPPANNSSGPALNPGAAKSFGTPPAAPAPIGAPAMGSPVPPAQNAPDDEDDLPF